MKKLFVLLFALLAFPVWSQVSLTIDGKVVTKASISISTDSGTVVVTPTCSGGQVWSGTACICPAGTWNGSVCEISLSPTCPGGQVWSGTACTCTTGTWNGSVCAIPPPPSGVTIRPANFKAGSAYTVVWGMYQPPLAQADNEIVAWEFDASQLVGPNNAGTVSLYSSSTPYEACISATPGAFDSPTSSFKGIASGDKAGITYVSWTRSAVSGYGKLPAPSAMGKLYLNVKKTNSTAYDRVPLSYFPLYQGM